MELKRSVSQLPSANLADGGRIFYTGARKTWKEATFPRFNIFFLKKKKKVNQTAAIEALRLPSS